MSGNPQSIHSRSKAEDQPTSDLMGAFDQQNICCSILNKKTFLEDFEQRYLQGVLNTASVVTNCGLLG